MATFRVRMIAFEDTNPDGSIKVREVDVPDNLLTGKFPDLDRIFHFGQNDFQPKDFCSVSVGDVIEFQGKLFVVRPTGFGEISEMDYLELATIERRERQFHRLVRPDDE